MEKVLVVVVMAALVLFGLSSPVDPVRYLGATSIPTDEWTFGTMPVGGISGLAYDPATDLTYAVSDDRGETGTPGRLYTLKIAVDQRGIRRVQVVGVAFLDSDPKTPGIQPYAPKSIDAEEVVLTPDGNLIISSERDLENRPWIREFAPDGSFLREIPLPEAFVPSPGRGTRTNFAFEGLGLTPAGDTLYVANEEALEQDGPLATVDHGTTVRILEYDLTTQTPSLRAEYAYVTEPIFASAKDGPSDNGVSAMAYIKHLWPEYDLLVVERAFATGVGNDVKLFGVKLGGADDVKDAASLPFPYAGKTTSKTL
ncbi:MAG: esterase-like activity of phytase family protein, partial [Candidatus Bipolaricaulota bacterium]|nr:esterase-like activity of phytase family protein [Candidatus Bipolaricaulota bacterium]